MRSGGTRRGVVLAAAAAVAVVWSVAVWSVAGRSAEGSGGGPSPDATRSFALPGGGEVAVDFSDGIVVSWRDPDGGWSDPDVVYDDDVLPVSQRIRVAGGTVAIVAGFTPEDTPFDGFDEHLRDDDVTVLAVCRDRTCALSQARPGVIDAPPQVTPDGRHALLAVDDVDLVVWRGAEVEVQQPSGLPDGDYGERQPLLAPDGSLRAVAGQPTSRGCSYTLLTAAPGDATFTPAVTGILRSGRRDACTTSLETFSDDYVVATSGPDDSWFLAREDDQWSVVAQDPSGQVRYPRTRSARLAGTYVRSGFWHWREVVASSPDGRTLVAQVHVPGEETWGPPRLVGRAPAGTHCTEIAPMPTYTHGDEDPFYLSLVCRSRPSPGADWTYSYPTAVTEDGRHWDTFVATDLGLRVGRDVFFRGSPSHRWSPDAGLREVDLPVPDGSVITLLGNDTYALSSLVPSGTGCAVEVRLADAAASAWGDPVPSTASQIPRTSCAFASVQGDGTSGTSIHHYLGAPENERMVRMVRKDGGPLLEDGPR